MWKIDKLELGGGNFPREGYTSLDLEKFTKDTIIWNLEQGLPLGPRYFARNKSIWGVSAGYGTDLLADNVLEHIKNFIPLMNDCYDFLAPGGLFEIIVPLANTTGDLKDPTHVRQFIPESFDYFDLAWDYPKQPDYGIMKWHVDRKELVGTYDDDGKLIGDYIYIEVTLRKPDE